MNDGKLFTTWIVHLGVCKATTNCCWFQIHFKHFATVKKVRFLTPWQEEVKWCLPTGPRLYIAFLGLGAGMGQNVLEWAGILKKDLEPRSPFLFFYFIFLWYTILTNSLVLWNGLYHSTFQHSPLPVTIGHLLVMGSRRILLSWKDNWSLVYPGSLKPLGFIPEPFHCISLSYGEFLCWDSQLFSILQNHQGLSNCSINSWKGFLDSSRHPGFLDESIGWAVAAWE